MEITAKSASDLVDHFEASDLVDHFEEMLAEHSISVPKHSETGADMLPFRSILDRMRAGFSGTPNELRKEYTAAVAFHDLAAKLLEVREHSQFPDLIPHLKILVEGAIHLTESPPAYPDGYNKLIEVYWASLCLSAGLGIELDHPKASDGRNRTSSVRLPHAARGTVTHSRRSVRPTPRAFWIISRRGSIRSGVRPVRKASWRFI
jgi:hypothetical protein